MALCVFRSSVGIAESDVYRVVAVVAFALEAIGFGSAFRNAIRSNNSNKFMDLNHFELACKLSARSVHSKIPCQMTSSK